MRKFCELKMRKIIVVSQPYTFVTGLRKYFRNQVIENVVSLLISPPQISPLFSLHKLYNSYNLFSSKRAFSLHAVLFVPRNFNSNVHALLAAAVCHKIFIVRFQCTLIQI